MVTFMFVTDSEPATSNQKFVFARFMLFDCAIQPRCVAGHDMANVFPVTANMMFVGYEAVEGAVNTPMLPSTASLLVQAKPAPGAGTMLRTSPFTTALLNNLNESPA